MDFKSLSIALVFNLITTALPIGVAVYFAITLAMKKVNSWK